MIDYTNSQISNLIDEYIHSERDRAILKRRLIDGICYEPLAEEFDLSVKQMRNIIRKSVNPKIFYSDIYSNYKLHFSYLKSTLGIHFPRVLFCVQLYTNGGTEYVYFPQS